MRMPLPIVWMWMRYPGVFILKISATLCEILTWNVPFGEEGGSNQLKSDAVMPAIPNVSPDIQKLIHACLAKEPGDRPTAKQLVEAAKAKQFPVKSPKRQRYI